MAKKSGVYKVSSKGVIPDDLKVRVAKIHAAAIEGNSAESDHPQSHRSPPVSTGKRVLERSS